MIIEHPACLWLREHTVGPTKLRGTSSFGISEVTLRMSLVPMSGVEEWARPEDGAAGEGSLSQVV